MEEELQKKLLELRSELPGEVTKINFFDRDIAQRAPDAGHDTARFQLGAGYHSLQRAYTQLGWRPALQDLNAQTLGYLKGSEIEILNIAIRYHPQTSSIFLDQLSLVNIVSLTHWDEVFLQGSWSGRLGIDPVRDRHCDHCLEWKANVGGGFAWEWSSFFLGYTLLKAEIGWVMGKTPFYRMGPLGTAGCLLTFSDDISLHSLVSYHQPFWGYRDPYWQGLVEWRISTSQNTDLRLGYHHAPIADQIHVGLNVYY